MRYHATETRYSRLQGAAFQRDKPIPGLVRFSDRLLGAYVLWHVVGLKSLHWQLLNKPQRGTAIVGLVLAVAAVLYPPWWALTAKGYFWGEREPMSFLAYAPIAMPPSSKHRRREIFWTLLALEIYLITLSTGTMICLLERRDRAEESAVEVQET